MDEEKTSIPETEDMLSSDESKDVIPVPEDTSSDTDWSFMEPHRTVFVEETQHETANDTGAAGESKEELDEASQRQEFEWSESEPENKEDSVSHSDRSETSIASNEAIYQNWIKQGLGSTSKESECSASASASALRRFGTLRPLHDFKADAEDSRSESDVSEFGGQVQCRRRTFRAVGGNRSPTPPGYVCPNKDVPWEQRECYCRPPMTEIHLN